MKIVQVTYTTTLAYAEQNKANIQAVMHDVQQINSLGIHYNCYLQADGKTFIHTAFYETEDDQKILTELPSFKHFRQQLKASMPEAAPKQQLLTLVGASTGIFNN